MKKKSRDFRRNRRNKWVRINKINLHIAIASAQAACRAAVINSDPSINRVQRSFAMIELAINSASQFANIINNIDKEPSKAINT